MTEQEPISILQLRMQLTWAERKYGKNSAIAWELRRQIAEARARQLSFLDQEQMELPNVVHD